MSRNEVGGRGGVDIGKNKGRFSSSCVEAFSWEIQPGLNSQQLFEPLELDHYKKEVISGMFSNALPGGRCSYGDRGKLQ